MSLVRLMSVSDDGRRTVSEIIQNRQRKFAKHANQSSKVANKQINSEHMVQLN